MANITVRNIPDALFKTLKELARIERRSVNNEILVALEAGIRELERRVHSGDIRVPRDVQKAVWAELAGKWVDNRSTAAIIKDILGSRSMGRDVDL